jgi:hypothetical protein
MTNRIAISEACDLHTVCVVAGAERYILVYDEHGRSEALRTLGRWAMNPDLSFDWYMAALASQKMRGTV